MNKNWFKAIFNIINLTFMLDPRRVRIQVDLWSKRYLYWVYSINSDFNASLSYSSNNLEIYSSYLNLDGFPYRRLISHMEKRFSSCSKRLFKQRSKRSHFRVWGISVHLTLLKSPSNYKIWLRNWFVSSWKLLLILLIARNQKDSFS